MVLNGTRRGQLPFFVIHAIFDMNDRFKSFFGTEATNTAVVKEFFTMDAITAFQFGFSSEKPHSEHP